MLTLADIQEKLRNIAFRIRIEPNRFGGHDWGTGFFISSDGHALTAYHNLPKAVRDAGRGTLTISYQNRDYQIEFLNDISLPEPEGDIAVLKLQKLTILGIRPVLVAYLPDNFRTTFQRRLNFWANTRVYVYGYPFSEQGQAEFCQLAHISSQGFGDMTQITEEGLGSQIEGKAEYLRLLGDWPTDNFGGLSGGPIFDPEHEVIVGVQNSYEPFGKLLRATEIARLKDKWPDLTSYAQPHPRKHDGPELFDVLIPVGPMQCDRDNMHKHNGLKLTAQIAVGPNKTDKESILRHLLICLEEIKDRIGTIYLLMTRETKSKEYKTMHRCVLNATSTNSLGERLTLVAGDPEMSWVRRLCEGRGDLGEGCVLRERFLMHYNDVWPVQPGFYVGLLNTLEATKLLPEPSAGVLACATHVPRNFLPAKKIEKQILRFATYAQKPFHMVRVIVLHNDNDTIGQRTELFLTNMAIAVIHKSVLGGIADLANQVPKILDDKEFFDILCNHANQKFTYHVYSHDGSWIHCHHEDDVANINNNYRLVIAEPR